MEPPASTPDEPLTDIFCNPKPTQALIYLLEKDGNDAYTREISRAVDTTYSHGVKLMQRLHQHGLVEREKKGRKKIYQLTEDGNQLASDLQRVAETCEDIDGIGFPNEPVVEPQQ